MPDLREKDKTLETAIKGLHEHGFTDREIADEVPCPVEAVRAWRRKSKQPANRMPCSTVLLGGIL